MVSARNPLGNGDLHIGGMGSRRTKDDTLNLINERGLKPDYDARVRELVEEDLYDVSQAHKLALAEFGGMLDQQDAEGGTTAEALAALIPLDRRANPRANVEWVMDRYLVPWDRIEPDDVPSLTALALLQACKDNITFYRNFAEKGYFKMVPTSLGNADNKQFNDHGQATVLLDDLDAEFEAEERELASVGN